MVPRFEKSLYDLIRGLRNHKGNEREYIQNCLKECRAEIRGADMDLKATALLKLIYLEMMGHDMSWASFHVLEVMSSPKYHQKRVGYLGAVQSFRPDTEVLMLATNLLKKDLSGTAIPLMSLPIITLPHIITPSLALSVQTDLLPRMGHSKPNVRKKSIVTLYRLALVYPETLLAAWPKIKERLMDKNEDPSVTAAIINVVCELGWRRPHDFLPLAPRFFELLVDGKNNWMAIKLIKLFATLTPLEPRLVRKLLPPLTEIIRTTPAMSLLYECINGIIQGGILGSPDDISGREEIASLCVDKLRSMILVDNDANLTYVALLAFNKIVVTHPFFVSQQEDVILECIDSPDITIRIKALDLVQGMVSEDNLPPIVSRLMKQLRVASKPKEEETMAATDEYADGDEEPVRERTSSNKEPALPEDYRVDVIGRILRMCAANNYSSLVDFDWYLDVLTQLVRVAPEPQRADPTDLSGSKPAIADMTEKIGDELRNVAVKVKTMRGSAVRAADLIAAQTLANTPMAFSISTGALKSIGWILGEYATSLASPETTLNTLLQILPRTTAPGILMTCIQAVVKIFSLMAGDGTYPWTAERKSQISLLMARIIHAFEPLALHPSLEVQERAIEFVELLKLTAEAASGQPASNDAEYRDPPLLLTQAIPSLFTGWELNSVAVGAQHNVPAPDDLDLDQAIHSNLEGLLSNADMSFLQSEEVDEFDSYYNQRAAPTSISSETASSMPAIARLGGADTPAEELASSYQQSEDSYLDPDIVARRKAERRDRNKDDPFYIGGDPSASTLSSTPIHNILKSSNGPDLDIDSIPIMQLDIEKLAASSSSSAQPHQSENLQQFQAHGWSSRRQQQQQLSPALPSPRARIVIAADETLAGGSGASTPRYDSEASDRPRHAPLLGGVVVSGSGSGSGHHHHRAKQGLLQVSSLGIGSLNLDGASGSTAAGADQVADDEAMARAVKEVERLRLEMQRASERVQLPQGVDAEGAVVKTKKVKKKKTTTRAAEAASVPLGIDGTVEEAGVETAPKKKKKKKAAAPPPVATTTTVTGAPDTAGFAEEGSAEGVALAAVAAAAPKKKKKKRMVEIED